MGKVIDVHGGVTVAGLSSTIIGDSAAAMTSAAGSPTANNAANG